MKKFSIVLVVALVFTMVGISIGSKASKDHQIDATEMVDVKDDSKIVVGKGKEDDSIRLEKAPKEEQVDNDSIKEEVIEVAEPVEKEESVKTQEVKTKVSKEVDNKEVITGKLEKYTTRKDLEIPTHYIDSSEMVLGAEFQITEGQVGQKTTVVEVRKDLDGNVIDEKEIDEVIVDPVAREVKKGTLDPSSHIQKVNRAKSVEAFNKMNEVRVANGLAKLEWSELAFKAGAIRAVEIQEKLSHTRPNGSKFNSLAPGNIVSENISHNVSSPADAISKIMDNDARKSVMMHDSFTGGAAVYITNESGVSSLVQIFTK